jgi:malate synthase
MIKENTCHRKKSARPVNALTQNIHDKRQHLSQKKNQLGKVKRQLLVVLFHIRFAVNAINDSYGIWPSLKMVLTPLNVTVTDFGKVYGVNR